MKKQKEIPKPIEVNTLHNVMRKYDASFTVQLRDGWANVKIKDDGDFYVEFLNDEGYTMDNDEVQIGGQDIIKAAEFIRELKSAKALP